MAENSKSPCLNHEHEALVGSQGDSVCIPDPFHEAVCLSCLRVILEQPPRGTALRRRWMERANGAVVVLIAAIHEGLIAVRTLRCGYTALVIGTLLVIYLCLCLRNNRMEVRQEEA